MENRKTRILLLVAEAWRHDAAGGNVINNIFGGMDFEFAQVYCDSRMPQNEFCKKYYQFSFEEMFRAVIGRKKVGRVLPEELLSNNKAEQDGIKKHRTFNVIKSWNTNFFRTMKKFICYTSNWKTDELREFITEFNPDLIFAPCYASPFLLSLTRYVKELTGKKIITYSGDSSYTLKQFSLSPVFWIDKFWIRHCLRKTFWCYDLFYSMSEDEIKEMGPIVKKEMKIFRKGFSFEDIKTKTDVNSPVKMIYAGGVYINRWKVLAKIGEAIKKINSGEVKIELHIYTGTPITEKQKAKLNDGVNIFLHAPVSMDELERIYKQSDIAIHCESFEMTKRYVTRLSFSTKIVDCLKSGCAVLAVAWGEHTGMKYLKENDAAICIENIKDIETTLKQIVDNPEIITEYSKKALALGHKNHSIDNIRKSLAQDFNELLNER